MSYRDLVQAVDDGVSELNDKIREYNEAVADLGSVLDDSRSACEELEEVDDDADASDIDRLEGEVIDAYPMKRDLERAMSDLETAADNVTQAREELVTALTERDAFVETLRERFDAAMRTISGGFPDTISAEEMDEVETLVDAVERFARAAL